MNDEMKEPDEEKALSESDERKPDFKAEQFSDGASDTPSSEIPPSNEDDGARKNEENDSLLTRAIHKLGNKKTSGNRSCRGSCHHLQFAHDVSSVVLHSQAMGQCNLYKPSHM